MHYYWVNLLIMYDIINRIYYCVDVHSFSTWESGDNNIHLYLLMIVRPSRRFAQLMCNKNITGASLLFVIWDDLQAICYINDYAMNIVFPASPKWSYVTIVTHVVMKCFMFTGFCLVAHHNKWYNHLPLCYVSSMVNPPFTIKYYIIPYI